MSASPLASERSTLRAHLDAQRRHVLGILEGLDEEAWRRPVLPSGWSCVGLVQHHLDAARELIDGRRWLVLE